MNVDDNTDPDMVIFQATYRRDEQWIVIQLNKHQAYYDVTYAGWEKDDVDVNILKVENCEFYLLKNMGRECAIWSNGPFECSIISDISSEELSKVIRSIYDRNG